MPAETRQIVRRHLGIFAALYLVAFVCYLVLWSFIGYIEAPDTALYLQMGRGIFEAGTFGFQGTDLRFFPSAFRMPVVPAILGLLFLVSGSTVITYTTYTFLQTALAPVLPCAAYFWGVQFDRRVGALAFVIVLLHGNPALSTVSVLTDIPFAFVTAFAFIAAWRSLTKPTNQRALVAGVSAAAACLIRPAFKFYPLLLVIGYVGTIPISLRRRVLLATLGVVAFCLVLSPWLARNYVYYRTLVIETNQGLNMLWSHSALVCTTPEDSGERLAIKNHIIAHRDSPMDFVTYRGWDYWIQNDLVVSKKLQSIALEAWSDNPRAVMRKWGYNMRYLLMYQGSFDELYQVLSSRPGFRRFLGALPFNGALDYNAKLYHLVLEYRRVLSWAYAIFAPVGLWFAWRANRRLAVFFLANIAYLFVMTAFVAGGDRYRLPLEPFFAVCIALAIVNGFRYIRVSLAPRRDGLERNSSSEA